MRENPSLVGTNTLLWKTPWAEVPGSQRLARGSGIKVFFVSRPVRTGALAFTIQPLNVRRGNTTNTSRSRGGVTEHSHKGGLRECRIIGEGRDRKLDLAGMETGYTPAMAVIQEVDKILRGNTRGGEVSYGIYSHDP